MIGEIQLYYKYIMRWNCRKIDMKKCTLKKILNMSVMENMLVTNIERMERLLKGKSPEFYKNFAMDIGGLIIWNVSLFIGMFVDVNKMHWLIYLLTNVCIMFLGHHISVEMSLYFGRLNGWWDTPESAKAIYKEQYKHLKGLVNEIKKEKDRGNHIDANRILHESSDDEEVTKKEN